MNIPFDNTYAQLPECFFAKQEPARVPEPKLIRLNRELAAKLSIDADWLESADGVSMLAGNAVPEGAEPIAQAYAGHQFCRFVPQLGDGPHVSRLRGRRSQRRGEVGSWDMSVVDAHPDRSSPKWPRAGRSLLFSKETRGVWTVQGTQNMTAIDNRFPKPRPLLGPGRPVAF